MSMIASQLFCRCSTARAGAVSDQDWTYARGYPWRYRSSSQCRWTPHLIPLCRASKEGGMQSRGRRGVVVLVRLEHGEDTARAWSLWDYLSMAGGARAPYQCSQPRWGRSIGMRA